MSTPAREPEVRLVGRREKWLRRWIIASGTFLLVLLVFQLTLLPDIVEAVHERREFGPFDFTKIEGTPKRSLEVALQQQSWRVSGTLVSILVSWGLWAAALFPDATLHRLKALSGRPWLAGAGFAAASLGFWNVNLEHASGLVWMLVAFGGLCVGGAAAGFCRGPVGAGRLVAAAALVTIAAGTPPWLLDQRTLMDHVYKEDALFELLQALWYATTALLLLLARRNASGVARGVLLLGGLGFAAIAGEEVSWGQRFLYFSTPDFWPNTTQDETTLHNIPGAGRYLQYDAALMFWAAVSLAAWAIAPLRRWLDRMGAPLVPAVGLVAIAAGLWFHPAQHDVYHNTDEIQETFGAFAALCAGFRVRYGAAGLLGDAPGGTPFK